jgi:hypothetical protein
MRSSAPEDTGPRGAAEVRPLTPVLLSLLLFPGLGQLAQRRPWRGLAYAAASGALLAVLGRRVWREAAPRLPADPEALLDPGLPFRLAAEIQRDNAAFFLVAGALIVLVWALSVLDAWRVGRREPCAPA